MKMKMTFLVRGHVIPKDTRPKLTLGTEKPFSLDCVPVLQSNRGKTEMTLPRLDPATLGLQVGCSTIEPPAPHKEDPKSKN